MAKVAIFCSMGLISVLVKYEKYGTLFKYVSLVVEELTARGAGLQTGGPTKV